MPSDSNAKDAEHALSALDHLKISLWRYPSAERLALYRNLGLGAAAVCFAILLAATQVAEKTPAIYVSLYASILGIPAWFVYGGVYDYYILLGKRSYAHFRSDGTQRLLTSVIFVAGSSLLVSIAALCQYLLPFGAAVFLGGAVVATFVGFRFHYQFAHWWRDVPRSPPDSDA